MLRKNIHREKIEEYKEINLLSPVDIVRLLKYSHSLDRIAAYNFFNCKCSKETKKYNKKWFGYKKRKSECTQCPNINAHLTSLYILVISLQYIYFLFSSISCIWSQSDTSFQSVISVLFCFGCTAWVLYMWKSLRYWISCAQNQSIFIIIGSLAFASSFHVSIWDLLLSLLVTQMLSRHLQKSKADGGYRNMTLVTLLNVHCVVIVQWITFILPSFMLLIISLVILPLTLKQENNIMQPADYPATILSFIFFNTIWMLLLAVIQHSEEKIGVIIPYSFLAWSDIEYWTHCFLMPIVSIQVLIRLELS